jgi:hypothetical protein
MSGCLPLFLFTLLSMGCMQSEVGIKIAWFIGEVEIEKPIDHSGQEARCVSTERRTI